MTVAPSRPDARARARRRAGGRAAARWPFLLPAAVFLGVLAFAPLVQLLRLSLSDVQVADLHRTWQFIGVQHFVDGFVSGVLTSSLWRTLLFVAVVTVLGLVLGIAAAVALRGVSRTAAAILALMVFVWALPPVVNGSVWKFLFADEGLINLAVTAFGADPVPFLYDERYALLAVALVNAWAVIPFNTLVFRAAILGIPTEQFEAAQLDGAKPAQELWHIVLPALRPTMLVLAVLTIVYAFRSFDFVYVMTKGGPGTATQTLPYLSFQQAFVEYDFSVGAATAVVTLVLVLVLAVVYARSVLREEAS